jgi:propionyl-CoA carboxylase alpha chain
MLRNVLKDEDFLVGETRTSYLDEHGEVLLESTGLVPGGTSLLVAAVLGEDYRRRKDDVVTGFAPSGWRNVRTRGTRDTWRNGATTVDVEYMFSGPDEVVVLVGPWPEPAESGALTEDDRYQVTARMLRRSPHEQVLEIDGVRHAVQVSGDATCTIVRHGHAAASWSLQPRFVVPQTNALASGPISPLPGTVIAVHVEPGQAVSYGVLFVVVVLMYQEHSILATGERIVAAVPFSVGDRVDTGDLLVEFAEVVE